MSVSAATVKQLRDRTGLGMMDCKKALVETGGDLAKAEEHLRKQGLKAAELRTGRSATEGKVGYYIHMNGKIGVLAEVNCETDFAAGNDDFGRLVKDICMQVAATKPKYVAPEEIPAKDTSQTVRELVSGLNAKLGENIVVKRFVRFEIGEEA